MFTCFRVFRSLFYYIFFFSNVVVDLYEGVGGLVQPADETVVGDGENGEA